MIFEDEEKNITDGCGHFKEGEPFANKYLVLGK